MSSKDLFLFVLIFTVLCRAQVLTSVSGCLGHCATCDPLHLSQCEGDRPCDWGFYSPLSNGTCIESPSTQVITEELGERDNKLIKLVALGWSSNAKQSTCQYPSPLGIQVIDVLGSYTGVEMIEKTFTIDPTGHIFEISFNLLHDEWLPFNDFLVVDLSSKGKSIKTLEISYDTRYQIDSQPAKITCNGTRVLNQKYKIKFVNNNSLDGNLTVIFTSFLFSATWALSDIRIVEGCTGYSMFNPETEKCDSCDLDSFTYQLKNTIWCEKCPSLCTTCLSATYCLTCTTGTSINENHLCSFGHNYKVQQDPLSATTTDCQGTTLMLGSPSSPIVLAAIDNGGVLYDEIQVGFVVYYSPLAWSNQSQNSIVIRLNEVQILKLDWVNLTNQATTHCHAFVDGMSKIELFSHHLVHMDTVVNLQFEVVGSTDLQIGVADVRVVSLNKTHASQNHTHPDANVSTAADNSSINSTTDPLQNTTNQLPSTNSTNSTPLVTPLANRTNITPLNNNNSSTVPTHNHTASTQPQDPAVNHTSIDNNSNLSTDLPTITEPAPSTPATPTTPATPVPSTPATPVFSHRIDFIPTLSNSKSGIEVHIADQPQNGQFYYSVLVDRLSPDQYNMDSYRIEQGKLMMFINFNQSFTDGTVSIYRHTATRLLQLSSLAPAPTLVGSFYVQRFDSLSASSIGGIDSFSAIFRAAAWVGLIMIMVTVLLGYGVVCEEYILSMQLIFLHAYIASDYLPLTFRDTIGGLSLIENLNFFLSSHSQTIEEQWMGNVLQNGPIRFFLFNTDINFLREFFPIIIINIVYVLWFGLLWAARRYLNHDLIDEEKNATHRFLDKTAGRVINFADQIWRYQFVATLWACFVQFYNFSYPDNSNRSSVINAILCLLAFFCTLAWPVFVTFYTRRYYYECEYSEYLHYFEDVYYLKIPQYELPSKHHRMGYPLVKTIKLFVTVLVICYLGNIASLTLVILILLQVVELIYIRIEEIFNNKRYYLMKVIESGLFVLMDVILLGLLNFSSLAISESYVYIGFILSGIALLVILNSLVRVAYLAHKKYLDSFNDEDDWIFDEKKPNTERVV